MLYGHISHSERSLYACFVDLPIVPLHFDSRLQPAVYVIAEKAADIIKAAA
ncbi:uncharacterized protein PHACADRAFT_206163 [Phanerochaete carnosa HHB-10118-sp]|uniref:Uncharacterized protein n=1 Tax=Phanerochaete carnosa (strain HHB-10118-sp) TaxID=650164 RepID=K5VAQ7_PHACS|nr:uncharacterized protein PHACADRAFT_206163 [Phanerochaete carnosa HHB-10118-sp]EKM59946.1 hypothetical protein PHACADRAFT_206163 [Phanerochaete carnosa HHB-10118-sp]